MNTEQKHYEVMTVPYRNDEIDLAELVIKIWQRKLLIIAITLLFAVGAIAYIKLAKPTFKLEGVFRPVLHQQFTELNLSGVTEMTPEKAMARFLNNLESRELRRQLFAQPGIGEKYALGNKTATVDQIFDKFNRDLKVVALVEKKGETLVSEANYLTFFHENPEYGVNVVNGMLEMANILSVMELSKEYVSFRDKKITFLNNSIANKVALAKEERELRIKALSEENVLAIKNTQDKLDVAREKAKKARLDRIKVLQEAIAIATALNIEMPTSIGNLSRDDKSSGTSMDREANAGDGPLYLRGMKFLSSELQSLEKRENDDFAEPAIRDLEADLALLKQNRELEMLRIREDDRAFIMEDTQPLRAEIIALQDQQVNFRDMQFVRIDQQATVPEKPIKPKKLLIVAMTTVFGMMIGVLASLLMPKKSEKGMA